MQDSRAATSMQAFMAVAMRAICLGHHGAAPTLLARSLGNLKCSKSSTLGKDSKDQQGNGLISSAAARDLRAAPRLLRRSTCCPQDYQNDHENSTCCVSLGIICSPVYLQLELTQSFTISSVILSLLDHRTTWYSSSRPATGDGNLAK